MSNMYLSHSSTETRDEAFKRMRSGNVLTEDLTSEKPRHRRVAYICSIQSGDMTKEQATALEEKYQKPSEMVLAAIARLQEGVEHPEGSLVGEESN